nr:hypothetical protein [Tanacetum cinerariifolium]
MYLATPSLASKNLILRNVGVGGVEFYEGEEDEKELVEIGDVGEVPFGEGEGGTAVAGVDRDMDDEKEET